VLKSIGLHHSLLSAIDEIQQDRNCGIAWTRRLSKMMWSVYERLNEPPAVTEEGSKKTWEPRIQKQWRSQHTWMNNHRKNSQIQSFCLNKTTRKYHKQHAKQSTDLRVTLTGSLDLQCQTETSKRSWHWCKKHNNVSQWQSYSFLRGKLQLGETRER